MSKQIDNLRIIFEPKYFLVSALPRIKNEYMMENNFSILRRGLQRIPTNDDCDKSFQLEVDLDEA